MPPAKKQKEFFSKVRMARELLREKSEEILREYLDIVQQAKVAGDYETAAKSLQWLIEHMPADDDGSKLVEQSVDKKQEVVKGPAPQPVMIGIGIGGVNQKQLMQKPTELPVVEVIDVE